MPHSPLALIPSSPGTTSSELNRVSAPQTWCFTARKPLFLRRRAPRPPSQTGFQRAGRGASPPANPYFFVQQHHVSQVRRDASAAKRPGSGRTYTDVGNGGAVSFCSPQKNSDATLSAVVGDFLSHCFLTAFIYFSSTQWNCPHSHPRFDSHH